MNVADWLSRVEKALEQNPEVYHHVKGYLPNNLTLGYVVEDPRVSGDAKNTRWWLYTGDFLIELFVQSWPEDGGTRLHATVNPIPLKQMIQVFMSSSVYPLTSGGTSRSLNYSLRFAPETGIVDVSLPPDWENITDKALAQYQVLGEKLSRRMLG